jgi:pyroglutamyl-peptidase
MNVLYTCFSAFPGVEVNPSRLLMAHIRDVVQPEGQWTYCTLPVVYEKCEQWARQSEVNAYDLVLHTGVATDRHGLSLERFAGNACNTDAVDADGQTWPAPVIAPGGPTLQETTLARTQAWSRMLDLQDVSESEDAGGYLCNFVYWNSLCAARVRTRVLFVHLPPITGDADEYLADNSDVLLAMVRIIADID